MLNTDIFFLDQRFMISQKYIMQGDFISKNQHKKTYIFII